MIKEQDDYLVKCCPKAPKTKLHGVIRKISPNRDSNPPILLEQLQSIEGQTRCNSINYLDPSVKSWLQTPKSKAKL